MTTFFNKKDSQKLYKPATHLAFIICKETEINIQICLNCQFKLQIINLKSSKIGKKD